MRFYWLIIVRVVPQNQGTQLVVLTRFGSSKQPSIQSNQNSDRVHLFGDQPLIQPKDNNRIPQQTKYLICVDSSICVVLQHIAKLRLIHLIEVAHSRKNVFEQVDEQEKAISL